MNADRHAEIMEEYRALREQNAREENRRLREVGQKDTALARLIDERHQMILAAARDVFDIGNAEHLEERMRGYNGKIRALLQKDGFPADYLEPVYSCPLCRDTGYVGETVKEPCACYKRRTLSSGFLRGEEQTFETFDETVFPDIAEKAGEYTQRDQMNGARLICERFADAFPKQSPQNLLIVGGSGLGKTFLLSAVAHRVRSRGYDALCVTAFEALLTLKNAFFTRSNEADALFSCELLLLDDLGMEPLMENVTVEQIYNLLNERLRRGLATVISTNLNMAEIKARYTERVASRLLDAGRCRAVRLSGQDVRRLARP